MWRFQAVPHQELFCNSCTLFRFYFLGKKTKQCREKMKMVRANCIWTFPQKMTLENDAICLWMKWVCGLICLPPPLLCESEAAQFSFSFPLKMPRGTIFLFNDLQNDSLEIWGYQSWKQCENNCGLLLYDDSGSWANFFLSVQSFFFIFPETLYPKV